MGASSSYGRIMHAAFPQCEKKAGTFLYRGDGKKRPPKRAALSTEMTGRCECRTRFNWRRRNLVSIRRGTVEELGAPTTVDSNRPIPRNSRDRYGQINTEAEIHAERQ